MKLIFAYKFFQINHFKLPGKFVIDFSAKIKKIDREILVKIYLMMLDEEEQISFLLINYVVYKAIFRN